MFYERLAAVLSQLVSAQHTRTEDTYGGVKVAVELFPLPASRSACTVAPPRHMRAAEYWTLSSFFK